MSVLNVVKYACSTAVMCLGINAYGMENNGNDNSKDVNAGANVGNLQNEGTVPQQPRLTDHFYERCDHNFSNWKEDLLRFTSEEFYEKFCSPDEKVKKEAEEEFDGWSCASCISAMFIATWGYDKANRKEAMELLTKANEQVKQRGDDLTSEVLITIMGNCSIPPEVIDGE